MPEQSNDYRVAVFGAGGVGKTSIVERFVRGTFSDNYIPTIEDTYRQVISCNKQQNVCTLQITDTTGSHQFPAMQRLSISRGHAFIMAYAVDKEDSFRHIDSIYKEIQAVKGTALEDTPLMLVGNKIDEPDSVRTVRTATGRAKADKWGIGFIETSAKNDVNICELFQQLLSLEKRRNLCLIAADADAKKKQKKEKKEKKEQEKKEKKEKKQQKQSKEPTSGAKSAASTDEGTSKDAANTPRSSKCSIM